MLVLKRKAGERLLIGDDIIVSIERISGNYVRIGVQAPQHLRVLREELIDKKKDNQEEDHQNNKETED